MTVSQIPELPPLTHQKLTHWRFYFQMTGRMGVMEYNGMLVLVSAIFMLFDAFISQIPLIATTLRMTAAIIFLYSCISFNTRRLHDLSLSGFWQIPFIFVVSILSYHLIKSFNLMIHPFEFMFQPDFMYSLLTNAEAQQDFIHQAIQLTETLIQWLQHEFFALISTLFTILCLFILLNLPAKTEVNRFGIRVTAPFWSKVVCIGLTLLLVLLALWIGIILSVLLKF